jgi:predicted O-methyltransferase YrrM
MSNKISHIGNKIARRLQNEADVWAASYWHESPFCDAPRADAETYRSLWLKTRQEQYPEIDAFEKEQSFAIDPEWFHNLALHTQIVIKESPLCYQHGRVLYAVLRAYLASRPTESVNIVETGTARGFSSIVMAKALRDSNRHGRILTFDLLPHDRKIYWNCIDDHEGRKTRRDLLSPWRDLADEYIVFVEGDSRVQLRKIRTGRIHFAFLDGAHSRKDILGELEAVVPFQMQGDIIVFDDYSPNLFPDLVQGIDDGCRKYGYSMNVMRTNGDRAYVVATKQ